MSCSEENTENLSSVANPASATGIGTWATRDVNHDIEIGMPGHNHLSQM